MTGEINDENIDDNSLVSDTNSKIIAPIKDHNEPEWDESHEKVLIEWADKAQCFRWLHGKSFNNYRTRAMWYTIPVIIMSTITGTANFAQERFPADIKVLAVMMIGGVNLIAGIITTISQYLKILTGSLIYGIVKLNYGKMRDSAVLMRYRKV